MTKTVRKFDIAEYSQKGIDAISKLMATKQPGHKTVGSKHDVVMAIREKIKAAHDAGYTVQQIAEAFKDGDVFGILPKTITEVLKGDKKTAAVKKPRRTTQVTGSTTTRPTSPQQSGNGGNLGTFQIKPDTPDGEL